MEWAHPPAPRNQLVLISQSLDEVIVADHPVRLVDEFLTTLDWAPWEACYERRRGQPPIHPRYVAGAILYGMMLRIRSSRDLEDATRHRTDFMWLLSGRTIDHSTFAAFRTRHGEQLKDLNRQISRALVSGSRTAKSQAALELILDGTRIRANSDRHGARKAESIERLQAACTEQLDKALEQLNAGDTDQEKIEALHKQIEQLERKNAKYRRAMEKARERDAAKRAIEGKSAKPVRVPLTDPDAAILPNKDGGFAPNYTPTATIEAQSGAIVSSRVVNCGDECQAIEPLVEDCCETLGKLPDRVSADGNFASGPHLEELESQSIEAYMPVGPDPRTNPACRPDPTAPVPEEQWPKLPRTKTQLTNAAFIYDAQADTYYCPMGRPLTFQKTGKYSRTGRPYRIYACPGRADCPLATQCIKGAKATCRTINRDQYQDIRDKIAERMASDEGRAIYARRAPGIEGVFGFIKQSFGVRQFLLRGFEKVQTEWNWICGSFNLRKQIALMQSKRCRAVA